MKKMHSMVWLLLLGLLPAGPLAGQQVFCLQECVLQGLERNFSIQIARNREQISENNLSLGHAGFLPTVELRAQQSGSLSDVEQQFTDGSSQRVQGRHNTTGNAGVSMGLTLFDGFRVVTTYRRLETLHELGELSTRLQVEHFISHLASEYFNLIQQQRLLDNLRYAVELSKERVRIDEERYLLGSGSKLQLLQAEVFLNADSSRLERQYEVVRASRIRLNELMALDDLHTDLVLMDTVIEVNPNLVYERLLADAVERNTSLQMAAGNQALSEHDRRIIASRAYPFLSLNAGYGYTYNSFQTGTVSRQQNYGLNYGLTLGVPLYDGANQRRRMRNADLEIENSRLAYEEIMQGIRADMLTIYHAYTNNLRLLVLETQNLSVARETLDIAMERYRLGALSGIELREVQKSLLDAEERLLSVQYQAKIAEISLMQLSGRILELI